MDFGVTDEQRALDASVRDYLADRFDLAAVRKVYDDPTGDGHPRELWSRFAEYGWLAVTVPEEHDGLGLGLVDAQVVARALGAGAVPGPWLPTVLATEAIRLAGPAEQQGAGRPGRRARGGGGRGARGGRGRVGPSARWRWSRRRPVPCGGSSTARSPTS